MSNLNNEQKATYAILADNVYWDVRYSGYDRDTNTFKDSNWTPVPDGWTVLTQYDKTGATGANNFNPTPELDGLSARVFQNETTKEIVISFAGTQMVDYLHDWKNNGQMGLGYSSNQANLAAELYQQVMLDNKDTTIKFTGHSLGGGLAALMGVWFDKEAIVFDPAPFKNAATNATDVNDVTPDNLTEEILQSIPLEIRATITGMIPTPTAFLGSTIKAAREHLAKKFGVIDEKFFNYSPEDDFDTRLENIDATVVKGEFLSYLFNKAEKAEYWGSEYVPDWKIPGGQLFTTEYQKLLDGKTEISQFERHTQTLLIAALASNEFENYAVSKGNNNANTSTLKLLMDEKLYFYDVRESQQNFLTKLVRSHIGGVDNINGVNTPVITSGASLLTHFGNDLKTLADGLKGYTNLANPENDPEITKKNDYTKLGYDTLIVQTLQSYYHQDITEYDGTQFFQNNHNTIQYTTATGAGLTSDNKADTYIQKWLSEAFVQLGDTNVKMDKEQNLQFDQWNVTLNDSIAQALDTTKTQILIAMGEKANFISGQANDLLLGSKGDDTLQGGFGYDTIYGGQGNDTLTDNGAGLFMANGVNDNDHLYGNDGNDILISLTGDDILEGGNGNDTYKFSYNLDPTSRNTYGTNVVIDEDGLGELYMQERIVKIGEKIFDNLYYSADKNFLISLTPKNDSTSSYDLTITENNSPTANQNIGGSVTIQGWHDGDLGLTRPKDPDKEPEPKPQNIVDYAQVPYINSLAPTLSAQEYYDLYNRVVGKVAYNQENLIYTSQDLPENNAIYYRAVGGSKSDQILFQNQNVALSLEGGLGSDIIFGGNKNDTIWVDDYISPSGSPLFSNWTAPEPYSVFNPPSPETLQVNAMAHDSNNKILGDWTEFADGGVGDDKIFGFYGQDNLNGSQGNDILVGAGNTDEISGGDGNDLLHGDGVVIKEFLPEYERQSYEYNITSTEDYESYKQNHTQLDMGLILDHTYAVQGELNRSNHNNQNYHATNLAYQEKDLLSG